MGNIGEELYTRRVLPMKRENAPSTTPPERATPVAPQRELEPVGV